MADPGSSFGDFEQAGWEDSSTISQYDRHLSLVTTQSIEALLDDAGVGAGSRVLDVATGAGYVAAAAALRGADPVGIDFSGAQVRLARQRYPGVRFEQADAEALPFESGTFDAVVNAFGMCHFPNPDVALREAFRVLKVGGRVAFSVWDVPERTVVFGAVYGTIRAHGSMDVGLPAGTSGMAYCRPGPTVRYGGHRHRTRCRDVTGAERSRQASHTRRAAADRCRLPTRRPVRSADASRYRHRHQNLTPA